MTGDPANSLTATSGEMLARRTSKAASTCLITETKMINICLQEFVGQQQITKIVNKLTYVEGTGKAQSACKIEALILLAVLKKLSNIYKDY